MKVRRASLQDVHVIVKIHEERFPAFFLSTLGKDFLAVFYTGFLKNPGVLLVLEDSNEIKGFAAGSRDNRGFFRILIKNSFFQFTWSGIKILFSKPLALKRMAFNVSKSEKNNLIYAELLSIATLANKKGYGKILLAEFEKEIAKENIENLPLSLTTDFDENEKAIGFYKESGYEVYQIFESYQNRKMYRFIKNIVKK
ncbi:GNAT family N-acetyltransferase [Chryseobacterium sp. MDT2-18]|uniref:GNAT family N-acetyltransferase n=1 Tax=Chryseobacterium sp. MDT2-18 TaxID=1259136 RepID=UPI0027817C84|nr:GNAT family N-acetyltransferase [Chryseobacterium sp. MDT2-18]MDQ0476836.1 ribosomal protein S18 acetylase RimI-like enzyme [Chryseobacterium sp. MDT2-18]